MFEIAYNIDKIESEKQGVLAVQLIEVKRQALDLEFFPSKNPFNISLWQRWPP